MFATWINMAMLTLEAQHVIGLRLCKLGAGGPDVATESLLMVREKLVAAALASGQIFAGGSLDDVVASYRTTVQANVARLSAG